MNMSKFNIVMNDSRLPEDDETVLGIYKLNEDNYSVGGGVLLTAEDILVLAEMAIECSYTGKWNSQRHHTIRKFKEWEYYERT